MEIDYKLLYITIVLILFTVLNFYMINHTVDFKNECNRYYQAQIEVLKDECFCKDYVVMGFQYNFTEDPNGYI